ncbi:MAG TPA: beta-L-arabinofuranosidase domain-containing protein, partial [Candidatus Saccharimonadia bacterium]|nr:beta-L-arabinofuranosidase domain-containing protein [Candidatus Saccharimonadia bacterium]
MVRPSPAAIGALTLIGGEGVSLTGGFWGERLTTNHDRTIPHGFEQLERAGNFSNLRLAAGAHGRYRALGEDIGVIFPFLDTDVYKWLEAVGWELGRDPSPKLARQADEAIALVERAQRSDGYLNSYVQVVAPGSEYRDLAWGHELYSFGHLIQAAVAWQRALGDDRLLRVATRAADAVDRELGSAGRLGIDGHPEIEMALVELFRTTGERRYLELAARFVEARGEGLLGVGRFGRAYWQDHARVRDAPTVAGHAVRQLYLDCGAVDVATELGDQQLLGAVQRRWRDMVATRMYLTGGLGSRHRDEAFGDPYELPPDRAYAETCASIAGVMLAWRLFLATGDPDCADVLERTAYNGVLPGLSFDGTRFFYVNTLQRRTDRVAGDEGDGARAPWFPCACCPPNVMRFLSSWPQYLATADDGGVQIHQFASGEVRANVAGQLVRVGVETGYPWDGHIRVTVLEAPEVPWTLSIRVPGWCRTASMQQQAGEAVPLDAGVRRVDDRRIWRSGDAVTLILDLPVRVTSPDPHVDAARGCVALERGPLVYCIETADLPHGLALEEVEVDAAAKPVAIARPDLGPDVVGLVVPASRRGAGPVEVGAVPYLAWANRTVGAM